jgi:beta-glucosidase/6-phospho-beta-glucosidase/beta-galactosidase
MQWFEDLGGFEKAENIQHFVAWSIKAVELFGSRITYWATFNEPTVRHRSSCSSSAAGAASRAAAAAAAALLAQQQ